MYVIDRYRATEKWKPVLESAFKCNEKLLSLFNEELSTSIEEVRRFENDSGGWNIYPDSRIVPEYIKNIRDYFEKKSLEYIISFDTMSNGKALFKFDNTAYNPISGEILYEIDGEWFNKDNVSETLNERFVKETKLIEYIIHERDRIIDLPKLRKEKLEKLMIS
jgi:hypothetical protein